MRAALGLNRWMRKSKESGDKRHKRSSSARGSVGSRSGSRPASRKGSRASIRSANTRTGFNSPRNSVSRGSRNSPSSRPASRNGPGSLNAPPSPRPGTPRNTLPRIGSSRAPGIYRSRSMPPSSPSRKKESTAVKVVCRLRPLRKKEKESDKWGIDDKSIAFEGQTFTYSKIFDEKTSQSDMYKTLAEPMLDDFFKGVNCCMFMYGQTGTGKSYTMTGGIGESRGLVPRILEEITSRANGEANLVLMMNFTEIYREHIYDLLNPESDQELQIRTAGGISLSGVKNVEVKDFESAMHAIDRGNMCRMVAKTNMNSQSSRSHSVLQISMKQVKGHQVSRSRMILVDLAGSERLNRTGAKGDKQKEGSAINVSLTTLGKVIKALSKKQPHVPFRESKLTLLLSESINGNCKLCIIMTASRAKVDVEETLSTLRFGKSAASIKTRVMSNLVLDPRAYKRMYREEKEKASEMHQLCVKVLSNMRQGVQSGITSDGGKELLKRVMTAISLLHDVDPDPIPQPRPVLAPPSGSNSDPILPIEVSSTTSMSRVDSVNFGSNSRISVSETSPRSPLSQQLSTKYLAFCIDEKSLSLKNPQGENEKLVSENSKLSKELKALRDEKVAMERRIHILECENRALKERAVKGSSSPFQIRNHHHHSQSYPPHQGYPPGHQSGPPHHKGTPPYHQGIPHHQGTPPYHQSAPLRNQKGLPPHHKGTLPLHQQGTQSNHQRTPSHHQGTPPSHHQGTPPSHLQGTPSSHHQGTPPSHHQGTPLNHQDTHGTQTKHQGTPTPHHQGNPSYHQGTPTPHHKGTPPYHQGTPPTLQQVTPPEPYHHQGIPSPHQQVTKTHHPQGSPSSRGTRHHPPPSGGFGFRRSPSTKRADSKAASLENSEAKSKVKAAPAVSEEGPPVREAPVPPRESLVSASGSTSVTPRESANVINVHGAADTPEKKGRVKRVALANTKLNQRRQRKSATWDNFEKLYRE
ncbi:hypothetical protein AAMO2058_000545800 [Amorphochlora amoebiformis]